VIDMFKSLNRSEKAAYLKYVARKAILKSILG
jgi:hypothetical protein